MRSYFVLDVAAVRFHRVDIFAYFGLNSGKVLTDRFSVSRKCWPCMPGNSSPYVVHRDLRFKYRYVPHNDVSVNDGPHIRRWSRKIIIYYYNTILYYYTILL